MFAGVADELCLDGPHALLLVLGKLLVAGDDHGVPGGGGGGAGRGGGEEEEIEVVG